MTDVGASGSPEADDPAGVFRAPYPDPPYGTKEGAIIENYRFLGWSRPAEADFQVERMGTVSLSDLYDPSGEKGIELIVLTSTAVWCTVCRVEYEDFRSGRVDTFSRRGVAFVGALFEDNNSDPAEPADAKLWASTYDVDFPFVLDPAFKLGAFFDREATPMTMIIDASTMQILWIEVGWALEGPGSVWEFLDSQLSR